MENFQIKLAPSILAADFSCLGEQVAAVTKAGADYIHVDVMDGHFVPNITIGAPVVAALRSWSNLPFDVHLMVENPEMHLSQFAKAGADILTVQVEVSPHLYRIIESIKTLGLKAGVALNPATPLSLIEEILPLLDLVLVMSVNPGFSGQPFMESMLSKIARLRYLLDERGLGTELEVDGGITVEIAPRVVKAGARVLVAGASVFGSKLSIEEAIGKIRKAISAENLR